MSKKMKLYSVIKAIVLSMITCLLTIKNAYPSNHLTEHLKLVGTGEMSWFFVDIYQASLYSITGDYSEQDYPQALNISYQKDIPKKHLIKATDKQWQHLSLNNSQSRKWLIQLDEIWPDIKENDQLLFVVESDGKGTFYHNQQQLGEIDDQQFSDAFLAIWLSPNSSQPTLRKQLLGE